jgi:hypothetical protein
MPYRIAGIDVHKKMLAVVVADVGSDGEYHFERQRVGTSPGDLRRLADWLVEREVEEVVMESTAQYWRPVWEALEQHWRSQRQACAGAARLWVSNSSSRGDWELDEVPAVRDPAHMI